MIEKPVANDEQAETSQAEDAVKQKEVERAEKLDRLVREIFEERREAFEELAKGYSSDASFPEDRMDDVMNSLMDRRSKLFEKLAEGSK